ncbi:MAG: hypothetical protein IKG27_03655 [Bacilli bacterium]|nr:hypothetical protein [Bacilli bacterium]
MKLDRKIIRVVVLPCNVESICPKCALRHLSDCNEDIYDVIKPLRKDSPIEECYETGVKRVVTQCSKFRPKPTEKVKVNPNFTWEYEGYGENRKLVYVEKKKNRNK